MDLPLITTIRLTPPDHSISIRPHFLCEHESLTEYSVLPKGDAIFTYENFQVLYNYPTPVAPNTKGILMFNRIGADFVKVFAPYFLSSTLERFVKDERTKFISAVTVQLKIGAMNISFSPDFIAAYSINDVKKFKGSANLNKEFTEQHMVQEANFALRTQQIIGVQVVNEGCMCQLIMEDIQGILFKRVEDGQYTAILYEQNFEAFGIGGNHLGIVLVGDELVGFVTDESKAWTQ